MHLYVIHLIYLFFQDCNHHGDCKFIDGIYKCICDDDWGGLSCDNVNYDLPSDHAVSVTLKKGDLSKIHVS